MLKKFPFIQHVGQYWPWLVFILAEVIFFILKVTLLSFRFGDGNVYWYMADVIRQGIFPYKDFFLADPPVFVFFLVPFVALLRAHLLVLQLLPAVLEMLTAAGLFLYLRTEKNRFYWAAPWLYLFSFTILATSDYGTGLQLANCFMMGSLLCLQRKKYAGVGILFACACLTKGFMAPVVLVTLGYMIYQKKWPEVKKIILGGFFTTLIILLPFLLFTGSSFINDILLHQLSRPQGISKLNVFSFFIAREWLFLLGTFTGCWIQRKTIVSWLFLAQLLFFILFKDLYYTYLGSLVIYMTILTFTSFEALYRKEKIPIQIIQMTAMIFSFFLVFSLGYYLKVIQAQGKFLTVLEITEKISQLPESYELYGSHEITPLLALLTHKKIFHNYIDTNTQTFASAAQDQKIVSNEAVDSGIYLLLRGQTFPKTNEVIPIVGDFFSTAIFDDRCKKEFAISTPGEGLDQVVAFTCN